MPGKKYIVRLTDSEKKELPGLIKKGKTGVRKTAGARILLSADGGEGGQGNSGISPCRDCRCGTYRKAFCRRRARKST